MKKNIIFTLVLLILASLILLTLLINEDITKIILYTLGWSTVARTSERIAKWLTK